MADQVFASFLCNKSEINEAAHDRDPNLQALWSQSMYLDPCAFPVPEAKRVKIKAKARSEVVIMNAQMNLTI